ncbi:glutathione S-transferase [uncultured Ramlibacter sp.]|uniref:glutathione S-transferase family protein n=1 Tax=uncultured Ramlibacter sp. TaxID=260755 RepID=UPI00260DCE7B|nr:glutathione S-transferase [uncultured Ramlibacter sp.]
MMELHYYPSTAAMVPHILLEEIGAPYERVLVDRAQDKHKAPEYLALNPNGLLPVLTDGELVLYETAAIVLHLVDTHQLSALAPAHGSVQRAHFHKWLVWLTNTLQATLIVYFYPERWMNPGNAAGAAELKKHAQAKVGAMLDQLAAELARHGGPWFMGETYTALDPYVFTLCRWTRNFKSEPARSRAHLGPYLQRMLERPAVQRVLAHEQLAPPYV